MKVLHLLKTSDGAAWALRLMKELAGYGIEVHVALPLGGALIPKYKEAGIIIHEFNPSLKKLSNSTKDIRKLVDEIKPDLIHSHFVLTTILMRLALRKDKTPRIFEVPGPLHLEHLHTRWIDPFLAQKNDYWIATCKWTQDRYIKSGVDPSRVFLTYYGGDISHQSYEKGKLRTEFGLDGKYVVGMVAYMYAPKKLLGQKRGLKGHEDFIDAIRLLQDKYPDIMGVCIGGAWGDAEWYEAQVKEYAKKKGARIIFTGTRTNVGELYQDIDCVVHPSHSENLGGAGESLMLCVPTIASSVGGFPDIVIDNETGLIVPPKNPEAIAEAIEKMYLDREFATESAKKGQEFVLDILDVRNTSKEVNNFYKEILSRQE